MPFDRALAGFADESICLLHLDGLHTYQAVSGHFRSWFPKVRPGGVILLHDITARHDGFGVWQFWDELASRLPTFSFHHSQGLGVIRKPGGPSDDAISHVLACGEPQREQARSYYAGCGERLSSALENRIACQLFCSEKTGYSAHRSSVRSLQPGIWQRVRLSVRWESGCGRLRFDPADVPGLVEIAELTVRHASSPEPVWRIDSETGRGGIEVSGTASRVLGTEPLAFLSRGRDPQLLLPDLSMPSGTVCLEALLRVRSETATLADEMLTWAESHYLFSGSKSGGKLLEYVRSAGPERVLGDVAAVRAQLESARRESVRLRSERESLDVQNLYARRHISHLESEHHRLNGEALQLRTRSGEVEAECQRLAQDALGARTRVGEVEAECQRLAQDALGARNRGNELEAELQRIAQEAHETCSRAGELEAERQRVSEGGREANRRIAELEFEHTSVLSRLNESESARAGERNRTEHLEAALAAANAWKIAVARSWSWRITAPLRAAGALVLPVLLRLGKARKLPSRA